MDKLPELSALVAKDLHGAERAITTAVRDTALMAHTLSSVLPFVAGFGRRLPRSAVGGVNRR